jgi:hypothetical protein
LIEDRAYLTPEQNLENNIDPNKYVALLPAASSLVKVIPGMMNSVGARESATLSMKIKCTHADGIVWSDQQSLSKSFGQRRQALSAIYHQLLRKLIVREPIHA